MVRHQVGTVFCQESTRFCNYSGDRFGGEITVIEDADTDWSDDSTRKRLVEDIERAYMALLSAGEKPQKARDVLPNILKSEIAVTMSFEAWLHFFDLRAYDLTGPAHPRMKRLATMALCTLRSLVPEVFGEEAFRIRWQGVIERHQRAVAQLGGDDAIGTKTAPTRYTGQGRETIDRIRDELGDEGFVAWCKGNTIKYLDRAGRKGSADEDHAKAEFYRLMIAHVQGHGDDPRSKRPGFQSYVRPE
jgi:hypothetical protein